MKTMRVARHRPVFLTVLAVVCSAMAAASTLAGEVDSITTRRIALDDSVEAVNEIFNERLREGVENANAKDIENTDASEFCDEERLYSELRKGVFHSFIPQWGLRGYDLDLQLRELLSEHSYTLSLRDSVYRDIDYMEGFSLNLKKLSDVINADGHLIGTDKIGHFFAEGWAYFERTRYEGESIEDAMKWGRRQEAGTFGYTTTGIHSFADLTANFNGWRFWNDILRTQDDPLKGLISNFFGDPYVECEVQLISSLKHRKIVKAWRLNKRFDLSEFVDGAWDEGNNCNSYADPTIEGKVDTRVSEIAPGLRCPVEPIECLNARRKYGKFAKHLLHPRCLTITKK
ncbi:MAG: hypothetical protein U5S82_11980 [Gammaproteobacteria bacterium]|nr:hypothetical protein [Gammaproteobacteria bacterium]